MSRVVVVGASVAGVHCSLALRSSGFLGEIVLVDQEDVEPYDKPPLSKDLLAGRAGVDSISLLSPMRAEQEGLTLLRGCTAIGVNVASRTLHLRGRDALSYDNLVIATGSRARTSPWCGNRIFSLRNLDDARAIRSGLIRGRRLVVVGAGFIGAEVAATARELGLGVCCRGPTPSSATATLRRKPGFTSRSTISTTPPLRPEPNCWPAQRFWPFLPEVPMLQLSRTEIEALVSVDAETAEAGRGSNDFSTVNDTAVKRSSR